MLLFILNYMVRSISVKSLVTAGQRQAESTLTKCVAKYCIFSTGLLRNVDIEILNSFLRLIFNAEFYFERVRACCGRKLQKRSDYLALFGVEFLKFSSFNEILSSGNLAEKAISGLRFH